MPDLWRITTRRATFGLLAEGGRVVDAAPISRWAVGQPLDRVLEWWRRRGAHYEIVRIPGA